MGFCLVWRVEAIKRMNIPSPRISDFPTGALRGDNPIVREWVGMPAIEESATLDLWIGTQGDLQRALEELNERMKELTTERISEPSIRRFGRLPLSCES